MTVANGLLDASAISEVGGSLLIRPPRTWGKRFRAAYANYRNGAADLKIMCVGDSTTYGVNTGLTTTTVAQSYPKQWAALLRKRGEVIAEDALFASGGVSSLATYDARISFSGTVPAQTATAKTTGGWALNWTVAGAMAFTPVRNVDTFVVHYLKRTTAGTFNLNIDGGANTLVTATNGSFLMTTQVMTAGSVGTHTLNLAWASGDVLIMAIDAYDSTVKQIKMWGAGFNGAKASDWVGTSNQWDPARMIRDTFQPHLVIVDLLINDWRSAIADATSLSNMQSLLTAIGTNSDLLLVTPNPETTTATYSAATQLAKISIMRQLATDYACPLVDNYAAWVDADGSAATMSGLSAYSDTVHPTTRGYGEKMHRIDASVFAALLA